jgi:hypothetical protein
MARLGPCFPGRLYMELITSGKYAKALEYSAGSSTCVTGIVASTPGAELAGDLQFHCGSSFSNWKAYKTLAATAQIQSKFVCKFINLVSISDRHRYYYNSTNADWTVDHLKWLAHDFIHYIQFKCCTSSVQQQRSLWCWNRWSSRWTISGRRVDSGPCISILEKET